jgi:2-octaprenyl-6-methoxyphenol hydroxylase
MRTDAAPREADLMAADPMEVDLMIVGAGLVGASLACALDGSGLRVALVEASAAAAAPPGFDERKLALAAASLDALAALDVLPRLPVPPEPIRRIHVSRTGDFGTVRLEAGEYGRDALGGVVLARELGAALEARTDAVQGLVRLRPATVLGARVEADAIHVDIGRGDERETWRARLLVAADGTRSRLREAAGIGSDVHDYGQHLFVFSAQADRAHDGTAYERFSPHGPLALLPMAGGRYGGLCGVATGDVAAIAGLDDAAFAGYFQERFGWRAGRIVRVGARSHYPLSRVVADSLVAPRLALVGNAAQTIHPVGAQGFNLGLRDALTLAGLVRTGGDIGEPARLAAYARSRADDRARTLALSDGLARLTARDGLPLQLLRTLGFGLMAGVPGLQAPLVAGAMGYAGSVR